MLSSSARFENNVQFSECYVLRRKIWKDLSKMSLTNPHTIRGRLTIKDVERFRNGSFHELSFESVNNFKRMEYIRKILDRR